MCFYDVVCLEKTDYLKTIYLIAAWSGLATPK
jgi:hypothetical protein